MCTLPDDVRRHGQDLRGLFRGELLEVAKDQRRLVRVIERVQRGVNASDEPPSFKEGVRTLGLCTCGSERGVPEVGQQILDRLGGSTGGRAAAHERFVEGDSVKPGTESGFATEETDAPMGAQKRLLGDLLRVASVVRHSHRQPIDPALEASDEQGERRWRSAASLLGEGLVGCHALRTACGPHGPGALAKTRPRPVDVVVTRKGRADLFS
jgi:hypothetical protein